MSCSRPRPTTGACSARTPRPGATSSPGRPLRPLRHRGAAGGDEPPVKGRGKAAAAKVRPRTASLFKDMDLATIDLDTALKAAVAAAGRGPDRGRRGDHRAERPVRPYLKKGTDSRSIETEQQLFDITLEQALAIYAQPKQRGRAAAKPPLAERHRPRVGQAGGGQGRPVRALRHRRRDQRDPAQGRRPREDPARARLRAARRQAGPRTGEEDRPQDRQEDHDPQDRRQEDHREEGGPRATKKA